MVTNALYNFFKDYFYLGFKIEILDFYDTVNNVVNDFFSKIKTSLQQSGNHKDNL